jgi:hypothetical protein
MTEEDAGQIATPAVCPIDVGPLLSLPDVPREAAVVYGTMRLRVVPAYGVEEGVCQCQIRYDQKTKEWKQIKDRCRVDKPGKHPRVEDWQEQATSDIKLITNWWSSPSWRWSNIALPMGGEQRLIVLDEDGATGAASLAGLEAKYGPIPETLTARSGRLDGGKHRYLWIPPGWSLSAIKNSVGEIGPNLDIRADGGLIIAPPSPHPSGNRYAWIKVVPIATCPRWLYDLAAGASQRPSPGKEAKGQPSSASRQIASATPVGGDVARGRRYGLAALRRAVETVAAAQEGSRNDTLNSEAFGIAQLVPNGMLDEGEARETLAEAARTAGLVDDEISRTLDSAFTAGMQQPRELPANETPTREEIDAAIKAITDGGDVAAFSDSVKGLAASLDTGSPEFRELLKALPKGTPRDWRKAVDDVRRTQRVPSEVRVKTAWERFVETPVQIRDGGICVITRNPKTNAEEVEPLCNFAATIEEEIEADDGAETTRELIIAGTLSGGEVLPQARVPAAEYHMVSRWALRLWGAKAMLAGGLAVQEKVREAIQVLSYNAGRTPLLRRVYRHTGWRQLDGRWLYLHNGGAVGGQAEVALDGTMARYKLPAEVVDPVGAVRVSIDLLKVAAVSVTGTLLGAVGLAAVASLLGVDFTVWLMGRTGVFKSELAALVQSFFGDFPRVQLPANWTSTENALEARLFAAKDAVLVIDDYAPMSTPREQAEQARKAARILRNVGNGSGRGRLRADLSQRPDRPPRCLTVVTAEIAPPSGSIHARVLVVPMTKGDVDVTALTRMQAARERLPHAMRAYLEWLAPQLEVHAAAMKHELEDLRREYGGPGVHARQPGAMAMLHVGLESYLTFAFQVGAVTEAEVVGVLQGLRDGLKGLAGQQARAARDGLPGVRFLQVIAALVQKGDITFDPASRAPAATSAVKPSRIAQAVAAARAVGTDGDEPMRKPTVVGWLAGGEIYLDRDLSFLAAARYFREAMEPWPVDTPDALGKALVESDLVKPDEDGRTTRQKTIDAPPICGKRHRVFVIDASLFEPGLEE